MSNKLSTNPTAISLELSQRHGSVAMMNSVGEIKSEKVHGSNRDADDVLPTIDTISESLGIDPQDIELVVVNIGPGGFTGLRTSVSISKMIALASGAKLVQVELAVSVANQSNTGDGPFLVISSVKEDSFWLSLVTKKNDNWVCESKNATTKTLNENINDVHSVFADEHLPNEAKLFIEQHGVQLLPIETDATSLLEVGIGLYKENRVVDPTDLLPLYPRVPEAVRVWKTHHPDNP